MAAEKITITPEDPALLAQAIRQGLPGHLNEERLAQLLGYLLKTPVSVRLCDDLTLLVKAI